MEFKVGDKVIVKEYDEMKKILKGKDPRNTYPEFIEEMDEFIGLIGTITSCDYNKERKITYYCITFEEGISPYYTFADWMLTKVENKKDDSNIITINLNNFSNYDELDDYIRDKTCNYFDKKVAREEFLKLEPTYEEIQMLRIASFMTNNLIYEDEKCYIYYNGANRIPALDRFGSIMNRLEYTDNVNLPINLLLGKEDEKDD